MALFSELNREISLQNEQIRFLTAHVNAQIIMIVVRSKLCVHEKTIITALHCIVLRRLPFLPFINCCCGFSIVIVTYMRRTVLLLILLPALISGMYCF